jgi:N-glycosylase/DNA lyase
MGVNLYLPCIDTRTLERALVEQRCHRIHREQRLCESCLLEAHEDELLRLVGGRYSCWRSVAVEIKSDSREKWVVRFRMCTFL